MRTFINKHRIIVILVLLAIIGVVSFSINLPQKSFTALVDTLADAYEFRAEGKEYRIRVETFDPGLQDENRLFLFHKLLVYRCKAIEGKADREKFNRWAVELGKAFEDRHLSMDEYIHLRDSGKKDVSAEESEHLLGHWVSMILHRMAK